MDLYTFYWKDGVREVLEGISPTDALAHAGYRYPGKALYAIDLVELGNDHKYEWSVKSSMWVLKI